MRLPPAGHQTAIFVAFIIGSLAAAAEKQPNVSFTTGANLVLVNATVLDRNHRPVRGLTRESFRLFENKVEQRISYFGEEELPLSLAVVFDSSGSMEGKIAGSGRALDVLLNDAGADDEFSLIKFADRAETNVPWTSDAADVETRVASTRPSGRTALLDAIHLALTTISPSGNKRHAVLILSDGGDNHSRHTERQIARILEEKDVQMYAIDMAPETIHHDRSQEEIDGPDLLERLCDHAGGRYFRVENQRNLEATADRISKEMRSQYVLAYAPPNAADGLFRRVRLQLLPNEHRSGFSIYWRRGYRSPSR